ncbi:hypothetical protein [Ammoniphilus sp. CFH 90114]|uniref:hypothetical protein n=1 Tax=Ammoniphilus sp. CFH 90114 TaxID=2493665 RepID=UPI00100DC790|nr:hypothetical protein [Ammoniphilus sp. CFH 90114]RXT01941.1 hypothetical protein EIZ39_25215 [Ammoniphilus sp. CFH 90114]
MKQGFYRVCEVLLALIFLGAGLNGYLVWFGFEPLFPTSPKAMDFLGTGYLLVLVKSVECLCGLMLFMRRFIPLTLLVLLPLIVNILAFHMFVDPELLPMAIVLILLESTLLWHYKGNFKSLLSAKSKPDLSV